MICSNPRRLCLTQHISLRKTGIALGLPRDLAVIFMDVDGKASVADLILKSGLAEAQLGAALERLVAEDYIKVERYGYRELRITSGLMNAAGNVAVTPDGSLSGRLSVEVGSRGRVVARSTLNVAGTVRDPVLQP